MFPFKKLLFSCATLLTISAIAPLNAFTVSISGTDQKMFPIVIGNFTGSTQKTDVSEIIRNDLERSGFFKVIRDAQSTTPTSDTNIDYARWKSLGSDLLVVGSLQNTSSLLTAQYRLLDIIRETQIKANALNAPLSNYRLMAHSISDQVFEAVTGLPGSFTTKIAFIAKSSNGFDLQISDVDGANPVTLLHSTEPIISPKWSPNGKQIAYVSFETGKPVIYVQDLATGKRKAVANFKGNNSAPTWSPDGRKLAITLSQAGGSQLYLINADGTNLQRLLVSNNIDTEPVFSPNGQDIFFTSDRGGNPQIYKLTIGSSSLPQRVSFLDNSQNTSPAISADGKTLAFVSRSSAGFRIAVLDLTTNQVKILSQGTSDLSPSFAPNGLHILYSTNTAGRGVLMQTPLHGGVFTPLPALKGNIQHPTWGPSTTQQTLQ